MSRLLFSGDAILMRNGSLPVVLALGTAQTLAWGSSYYLPAILADPIAQAVGVSRTTVFALFSGALLLSAVLGPFQSGAGGRARPARCRAGSFHSGSGLGRARRRHGDGTL